MARRLRILSAISFPLWLPPGVPITPTQFSAKKKSTQKRTPTDADIRGNERDFVIVQLINGLAYGGLLYVVAVGLVLIFGLRQVVNFAHGSLFMLGAYVGYVISFYAGFWAGLVVAIAALGILGSLLDIAVFGPLRHRGPMTTVLVTFGLALILEDFAQAIWGKGLRLQQPPPFLSGTVAIFGDSFPVYRLAVIAMAAIVCLGLAIWMRKTRVGLFVRASSVDPEGTAMQGVNTDRLSILVVGLGTSLSGLAGVIAAPLLSLSPSMGSYVLIDSFIVVVLGGIGSFSGAFLAAILIGQIHNLGVIFVPSLAAVIPLALMSLVLMWRPSGLAGTAA